MLFLFIIQINIFSQDLIIDRVIKTEAFNDTILELWGKYKPFIENSIDFSQYETYNLYKVQITTNVLLQYAFNKENYDLVDDLLDVYMKSLSTLDTLDRYKFSYFFTAGKPVDTVLLLDKTYVMWIDGADKNNPAKEKILSISQFLALISEAIFKITLIQPESRTDTMKKFVRSFSPVLDSHFQRWVKGISVYDVETGEEFKNVGPFQRRGWGCKYNNTYISTHLTHNQLIDLLFEKKCGDSSSKKYCNSITDVDLWIIAGLSSFVSAYLVDSNLVGSVSNLSFYKDNYLPTANDLIISRISTTVVSDSKDSLVWGADFDNGMLDDYPDNKFAGYNNPNVFPTTDDISWPQNLGWDLSHSRRFVNVFKTLYDTKDVLGFDFPGLNIMAMFANQFAYKTFNRDFEYPLFSNFFDGTNGWYRVGYSNRINFGYGPSDFSISALTGGFSFWSVYNTDIRKIMNSLYCLIHTNDSSKEIFLNQHYEKNRWTNDTSTNLPQREQFCNFDYNSLNDLDSASLYVLLTFYSSIGFSTDEKISYTKKLDDIIIYPNPSTDNVFIISKENISEIFIIDSNGHQVFYQKFFNTFITINIGSLKNGIYIIKIKTEKNQIISKKIVIN